MFYKIITTQARKTDEDESGFKTYSLPGITNLFEFTQIISTPTFLCHAQSYHE